MKDLWSDYRLWIYQNYSNKFDKYSTWTFNRTMNSQISFSAQIEPWGTDVARIGLSIPSNSTVFILFNQTSTTKDDFNITAVFKKGNSEIKMSKFSNNSNASIEYKISNESRIDLIITRFRDVTSTSSTSYKIKVGYAKFEFSNLSVNKTVANTGEAVGVSANVKNIGSLKGTVTANLVVDGVIKQSKNVTLNAGETKRVNFSTSFSTPVNHTVTIDGLSPVKINVYHEIDTTAPQDCSYIYISGPGKYFLPGNLTKRGLIINSSNVIFDGNGHTINASGCSLSYGAIGIYKVSGPSWSRSYTAGDLENIIIRNVVVKGDDIEGRINHSTIENVRVSGKLYDYALQISGYNNIIKDSIFSDSTRGGNYTLL